MLAFEYAMINPTNGGIWYTITRENVHNCIQFELHVQPDTAEVSIHGS